MSLSSESKRGARDAWRRADYGSLDDLVTNLERLRESNPSAGDFSAVFGDYLALVIADSPSLDDQQKATIRHLCEIVFKRPFPAKPWALIALDNLDSPHVLEQKLELFLEDKRRVECAMGGIAARHAERIGLGRGSNVLVVGFSYMFPLIFPTLADRSTLTICALKHVRRQLSEGEELKKQLLARDSSLRVDVREDLEAIEMLRSGAFDTLVMSAKAIGLYNGELSIIRSVTSSDLPRIARQAGAQVLVASGKYKIWPERLFTEAAAGVVEKPDYDVVMPGTDVDWLLTEDDVLSPADYRREYNSFLATTLVNYPGWVLEPTPSESSFSPQDKALLKDLLNRMPDEQRSRLLASSDLPPRLTEAEAEALSEYYSKLVDKKFSGGLTKPEAKLLEAVGKVLDQYDEALYEPIKQELRRILEQLSPSR